MKKNRCWYLLYDIDLAGENIKIFKCLEMKIEIENIQVKALLDLRNHMNFERFL